MGYAFRGVVSPRWATRSPFGFGVGDEGAGARLAFGEIWGGASKGIIVYASVSPGQGIARPLLQLRTSGPRAVPGRGAKAEAYRVAVPYVLPPRRCM